MKSQNSIIHRVVFVAVMSAFVVLAGMQIGCVKTQSMHSSASVPASEGTVSVSKGENDNTNITIEVKHLAPPPKMASDATVYVVWIQPMDNTMQNVGAMILDDNLTGTLNTVTPHRRFKVLVTPEPSGKVAYPTHEPVFTSDVERSE